jgi:hypothetical protein
VWQKGALLKVTSIATRHQAIVAVAGHNVDVVLEDLLLCRPSVGLRDVRAERSELPAK